MIAETSNSDFLFLGNHCCTLWVLLNSGIIKNIFGLKKIEKDSSVIFIMQRFNEGDEVLKNMVGNEKQVLARIYIVSKTKEELVSKINSIKSNLSVIDKDDNEMIIDLLNTSLL